MIWYILYPLRGTTEPPKLSPSHPVRKAFQRHGTATARHWLLSILVSVAIAILLCYPALSLDVSPAAHGLYNLPHHAWTSTTEFEGNRSADVAIRQVWVHGHYMRALDRHVLHEALRVQKALTGNEFEGYTNLHFEDLGAQEEAADEQLGIRDHPCALYAAKDLSWGFHSPLMFWNCSSSALDKDDDVLTTINTKSGEKSFLNVTLRPSSVLAGKVFERTKLRAADALVISLFDRSDSRLGEIWGNRTRSLATDLSSEWSLYPPDGKVVNSKLYEFRFKPMSLQDDFGLAVAYFGMAVYLLYRLRKLRAVKSKIGLAITLFAKISTAIIASFTICGMLKINLSHIPREAYPFVVWVFGLGNIFRLIDEVLATPPEMPTTQRIGDALGAVGHLSLATSMQNLVILYFLSRFVVPEMAAFCAYAAVALVFDYIFHLTFFLAVLSVDVRRMELQDSLERISHTQSSMKSVWPERQSWLGALRQGQVPFKTRIAGSASMIAFVLALNWHYFDSETKGFTMRRIIDMAMAKPARNSTAVPGAPPPIYQARTPADWFRNLDHDTAKELLRVFKPGAHSFIARVYDPLLVVLKGAEGRDTTHKAVSRFTVLRQLAYRHFFPAALIVVFIIGLVTILMNYLLWNEFPEGVQDDGDEEPVLSVTDLPKSHNLDVIRLTSCADEHLISISVDRSTSVWYHDRARGYRHTSLRTANMNPVLWPIMASAIDDTGRYLAICTDEGKLAIWSLPERRSMILPSLHLKGHSPLLFTFISAHDKGQERPSLVIVSQDSFLTEVDVHSSERQTLQLCDDSVISAALFTSKKGETSIVAASRDGSIYVATATEHNQQKPNGPAYTIQRMILNESSSKPRTILTVPALSLILLVRASSVDLVDLHSQKVIHTIQTDNSKTTSVRLIHSSRRLCSSGGIAAQSLSIVYTLADRQDLKMQTYSIDDTPSSTICLHPDDTENAHNCRGLSSAIETVHTVEEAGVWETTEVQSVIGVRKRPSRSPSLVDSLPSSDTGCFPLATSTPNGVLHKRSRATKATSFTKPSTSNTTSSDSDIWEAYTMTASGTFHSAPLFSESRDAADGQQLRLDESLFVANPGPITRLGKRGVAVGFGNGVKIIMPHKERFGDGFDKFEDMGTGSYRAKKGGARKMQ